jgi:hypothetical protein
MVMSVRLDLDKSGDLEKVEGPDGALLERA